MRILIVDDSAIMRRMIRRVVLLSGIPSMDVMEAPDGAVARAILESNAIDILLTDLHMPVMTGVELLRGLTEPRWNGLTRVVFSTDSSCLRRDQVKDLGVAFYLEKPFSPEMMRDVLNEVIPSARA